LYSWSAEQSERITKNLTPAGICRICQSVASFLNLETKDARKPKIGMPIFPTIRVADFVN
jgi:hypothetical protein